MAGEARKAENACTAEQIVDLIRAADNERFCISRGEGIELIEQYAAVVAAEAAIKATRESYDNYLAITDEALSKPLVIKACHAPIEGTKNLCTRDAGHPGDHRCLAIDVDSRRARSASPIAQTERAG